MAPGTFCQCFWHDETGVTTMEYALMLALVALAAIAAWTALGQRKSQMLQNFQDAWAQ